jgi:hypothetical protein
MYAPCLPPPRDDRRLHHVMKQHPCLHQPTVSAPTTPHRRSTDDGLYDTERRLWFSTHPWIETLLDETRRKLQV